MAFLVMKDSTKRPVDYATAAKVFQVLIGNEQPENDDQKDFVATVERVEFDSVPRRGVRQPDIDPEVSAERRRKIAAINADPKITGKEKYYAIGEVLFGKKIRRQQGIAV